MNQEQILSQFTLQEITQLKEEAGSNFYQRIETEAKAILERKTYSIMFFLNWLTAWYEAENTEPPQKFLEALKNEELTTVRDLMMARGTENDFIAMARGLIEAKPNDALWIIENLPLFLQAWLFWIKEAILLKKETDSKPAKLRLLRLRREERQWVLKALGKTEKDFGIFSQ